MDNTFFLKGDICYSSSSRAIECAEDSYLLCVDGKSGGVFKKIPEAGLTEIAAASVPVIDYSGMLIIPGLTDLHIHAPQFAFRALGMDMELLNWLNDHAFPEEARYDDCEYAKEAYGLFIEHERKGPNTRLCVFATIHTPSAILLADMLEESGLVSMVGKVSMDRNCPDYLKENDAAGAVSRWIEIFQKRRSEGLYKNTLPVLTPRFIPVCSEGLLKSLSGLQAQYSLPLQSHLSENRHEIDWVKELCPKSENYAEAYADAGLLQGPTIMAHCVWSDEQELNLLAEKGVYAAHCPQSNTNLSSGIAPVRRFLERGVKTGLGSDIAGGAHYSIFRAMSDAIQVSKLREALVAPQDKALTLEEAFYLGTAGGGSFFGNLPDAGTSGSFEAGWDFDALVIDDSGLSGRLNRKLSIRDRLERVVYLSDDSHIKEKYVRGKSLF